MTEASALAKYVSVDLLRRVAHMHGLADDENVPEELRQRAGTFEAHYLRMAERLEGKEYPDLTGTELELLLDSWRAGLDLMQEISPMRPAAN